MRVVYFVIALLSRYCLFLYEYYLRVSPVIHIIAYTFKCQSYLHIGGPYSGAYEEFLLRLTYPSYLSIASWITLIELLLVCLRVISSLANVCLWHSPQFFLRTLCLFLIHEVTRASKFSSSPYRRRYNLVP